MLSEVKNDIFLPYKKFKKLLKGSETKKNCFIEIFTKQPNDFTDNLRKCSYLLAREVFPLRTECKLTKTDLFLFAAQLSKVNCIFGFVRQI